MKRLLLYSGLIAIAVSCKNPVEKPSEMNANTIHIKGSDTELWMVKELAKIYSTENKEVNIQVDGGGSGRGFESLIDKECDIANASREIMNSEKDHAIKNDINPIAIMFAVDALAIVTNSHLGVDSLSTQQLTDIFSGHIKNWKELGGPDLAIHLYGRDSTSGTYYYFKDKFIKEGYDVMMKHLPGNADIVKAVEHDLGGIGYAGVGYLMDENGKPKGNIWAMLIYLEGSKAFSPYETHAVKRGDYVLTRPLYQYINGRPNEKIYDFMMFELSKRGQDIVRKFGYFPINDYQKEINRLNGLLE